MNGVSRCFFKSHGKSEKTAFQVFFLHSKLAVIKKSNENEKKKLQNFRHFNSQRLQNPIVSMHSTEDEEKNTHTQTKWYAQQCGVSTKYKWFNAESYVIVQCVYEYLCVYSFPAVWNAMEIIIINRINKWVRERSTKKPLITIRRCLKCNNNKNSGKMYEKWMNEPTKNHVWYRQASANIYALHKLRFRMTENKWLRQSRALDPTSMLSAVATKCTVSFCLIWEQNAHAYALEWTFNQV